MASIDSGGGGGGGKKSVDQEIPLIPFIDLLFCCVMFLLMTAVWNKLGAVVVNQQVPGPPSEDSQPDQERVRLMLQIQGGQYRLASSAGDSLEIPMSGDAYDLEALTQRLEERKLLEPDRREIIVAPEDGVAFVDVVQAMDLVVGAGFPEMSLSDGASLM